MSAPEDLPRPWPFMEQKPEPMEYDDMDYEDLFCQCDLAPTMSESDMNKCAACGKPIA